MSQEEKRIRELEEENKKLKRQIENTAYSPYLEKRNGKCSILRQSLSRRNRNQ